MSEFDTPIYVAGHRGMVGSALVRALEKRGHRNLILRTSAELDLRDQSAVLGFLAETKPNHVYLAAAKVGGIHANNAYKADFLYDNLLMQANVIEGVALRVWTNCCFWEALAFTPNTHRNPWGRCAVDWRIGTHQRTLRHRENRGLENVRCLPRPTRLQLHQRHAHEFVRSRGQLSPRKQPRVACDDSALPEAKVAGLREVVCWGSGTPMREFLHVDDLAEACLHLMDVHNEAGWVNVGTGKDVTIERLPKRWPPLWVTKAPLPGTPPNLTAPRNCSTCPK